VSLWYVVNVPYIVIQPTNQLKEISMKKRNMHLATQKRTVLTEGINEVFMYNDVQGELEDYGTYGIQDTCAERFFVDDEFMNYGETWVD